MAELSAIVTDTHPLIFHAAGGRRLGRRAARHFDACERKQALTYVPAIVMWECSLLVRIGRIDFGRSVRAFFDELFSNPAFQPLELTREQVMLADERQSGADPFDALICAAALSLELPLITRDAAIKQSRIVRVVW